MSEFSETREAIRRSIETQLNEWSTRIDHLRAEAERDMADAELRTRLYGQLQRLREKHAEAMAKLEDLKDTGEQKLEEMKRDLDGFLADLRDIFSKP